MAIPAEVAGGYQELINYSLHVEQPFLRARGFLVAGIVAKTAGQQFHQSAMHYLSLAINAVTSDPSEVVQVACIRALQDFLQGLPSSLTQPSQTPVINSLSEYVAAHDLREMADSDDLQVTLVETLRDAILVEPTVVLQGEAINVLFTLASNGASHLQLSMLVTESFESIVQSITSLPETTGHPLPYHLLTEKVLPSLMGAFDVGDLTQESALTNLAAELLSALAENGSDPLPDGFVAAAMPKLNRVLLSSADAELLRPATLAVKEILAHGHQQLFEWTDPSTQKGGVETLLVIIDRLLSPTTDDNAAMEVGALAAELVEKAGSERLGPYLLQLLQAVALRLDTAVQAAFIQSLILVFARLSLAAAKDVVDFLSQVSIRAQNDGLSVVLSKWLENSINFAGYDEIRQNVIALSKIYLLNDPRINAINVKGDLIVNQETQGRIKTRSQAKMNPDTWTIIPADLKILKVLVEELSSASTSKFADPEAAAAAAAALDSENEDDEDADDWEDVGAGGGGVLDLGAGVTKQDLMGWAGSGQMEGSQTLRARDDETTEYLVQFFNGVGGEERFVRAYEGSFTEEERAKLRDAING